MLLGSCVTLSLACQASGDESVFDPIEAPPQTSALTAVWSFGATDVWVAADGGRMLHFDGAAWETHELGAGATMADIWAFAPDDVWAVGGTSLARYDGATWRVIDLSAVGAGISSVTTVWGLGPDDLWVAGDQSTAAHFDGTDWTRHVAAGTENIALWGASSDDVYVGGIFDVAHWDGTAWSTVDPIEHGASAIWGSSPNDVWVADDSELAHFDGSRWSSDELDGLGTIASLWGTRSDDIWGVGEFGLVAHFDGTTWNPVQSQAIGSPFLESLTDVHGSGDGDVWAVGVQQGAQGVTPRLYRYVETE